MQSMNLIQRYLNNLVEDFDTELDDIVDFWHEQYKGDLSLFEYIGIHPSHYDIFLKCQEDFKIKIKEDNVYE